jgi:hypothetical protein
MSISTRQELIDYALRKNGFPVVEVNVSPDQLEDRVDDALQFFREYLYSGTGRGYIAHEITQDDITNGWIPVPEEIISVIGILPVDRSDGSGLILYGGDSTLTWGSSPWASVSPRIFTHFSAASHVSTQSHINTLRRFGAGRSVSYEFNPHQHRLYIFRSMSEFVVGDFIVMENYYIVDPELFVDVYDDIHLKEYVSLLVKKQWGENMSKFDNIQLMGGVTFDGKEKYNQAVQELERLEEKLRLEAVAPPRFLMM